MQCDANTDGWVMCLAMKFYYETLSEGEWRAKHIVDPQQSTYKWKEQQKIEKDVELSTEGDP